MKGQQTAPKMMGDTTPVIRKVGGQIGITLLALLLALGIETIAAAPAAQPKQSNEDKSAGLTASLIAGRRVFVEECASCHGLDARGGERAPNILARPEVRSMSNADLYRVIRDGMPGNRMPAFAGSLDSPSMREVATYLGNLIHGRSQSARLPGDPAAGKALFFGKAGCAECHMISGSGGFLGADLSVYASSHRIDEIRDAVTKPTALSDRRGSMVTVVTREGQRLVGIARNEDNFSLQLQTADGAFHLLTKSDLERIDHGSQPLMPTDYAQRLGAHELKDLISFLIQAAANSGARGVAVSKRSNENH